MPAPPWRVVLCVLALVGAVPVVRAAPPSGNPRATVETEPVLSTSDAADDAAIWPHPHDPSASLIIGTDKRGGAVEVYGMDGRRLQRITDGRANGVDLRTGFDYDGAPIDLVAVGGGDDPRFYRVDTDARRLVAFPVAEDRSTVRPNGVCLYRSPASGRMYLFSINLSSEVEQSEITVGDEGLVLRPVRGPFDVGSDAEACVADDDLGRLYVNEADHALWRYGAEPDDSEDRVPVDTVGGDGHLAADVEGLTIVYLPGGAGYLLASSQGDDSYTAYERQGANTFVRKFEVEGSSGADGCGNTDGIDALAADLGPGFHQGIFVCQDHHNGSPNSGNQNFKYVPLEDVVDLDGAGAPSSTTTTRPATTTTTQPATSTSTTMTAPPTTTTTATTSTSTTSTSTTTTTPPGGGTSTTTRPTPATVTTVPGVPVSPAAGPARSGYLMLGADGRVYPFGEARLFGDLSRRLPTGVEAVDLEPTGNGDGYWIVDRRGTVTGFGAARHHGDFPAAALRSGEEVVSLSATPTGEGYWIFTSRGSVTAFGDARYRGDLFQRPLNAPVLDSIPTPSGRGYYMVAGDGGIFTFGDARFAGSMGAIPLNAPVQSLVPDPDGHGYWLVAADGGIFAFDAPFRGSMGDQRLNRPVTGMVPFGDGYLMVGADGGIFNFSDRPFSGSLGADPPRSPIVAVGALR